MDIRIREEKSFTLMEIMIVVIIITIVSGIAITSHRKTVQRASIKQAEALLEMIYDAEKYFHLDNDTYVYGEEEIKDKLGAIDDNDIELLEQKGFTTDLDQNQMELSYGNCVLSIDITGERKVEKTNCTFE